MTDINCESVCIAVMAIADGAEPPLREDRIKAHLVSCADCRGEVEQLQAMMKLLNSQQRRKPRADIWALIEQRINLTPVGMKSQFGWRLLLFFGLPLFGYKAILLLLNSDPSFWLRFVPALFVIAVFAYLKENPFKINCELNLEGE